MEKIKKTKLILFFFNKMAPKTLDGSAFSFTTTRGHTTHISILWVFVLFTFLAVAVVSLGGFQQGLVERQFPDTKVHGNLEAEGILSKTGLVSQTDLTVESRFSSFTAENNRYYLIGTGFGNIGVTLPTPVPGNTIRFLLSGDIPNTLRVNITSPSVLALGSTYILSPQNSSALEIRLADGNTDVTLRLIGTTDGGGGVGTSVECYAVRQDGNDRWYIRGFGKLQANLADTSDFV